MVGTLPARLAGVVALTAGAVVSESALVANVHTKLFANGTWAALLTPVVIVPVMVALAGSKASGIKIAMLLVGS